MPDLVLYQFPPVKSLASVSPFCLKVHGALRLKGLAYRTVDMHDAKKIRAISPTGKLPLVGWDDEFIHDSTDILDRIDAAVPQPALVPHAPDDMARCMLIEDWADESLYFAQLWHRWVSPEGFAGVLRVLFGRVPQLARARLALRATKSIRDTLHRQGLGRRSEPEIRGHLAAQLNWIETLLGPRDYLFGTSPTRADLAVAAQLVGVLPEWMPDLHRTIRGHTAINGWLERMQPLFARRDGSPTKGSAA